MNPPQHAMTATCTALAAHLPQVTCRHEAYVALRYFSDALSMASIEK